MQLICSGCSEPSPPLPPSPSPPVPPLANAGFLGREARTIEALVALPAEALDIGTAALVISHEIDPTVDIEAGLARLDELALELRVRIEGIEDAEALAEAMLLHLNVERGFHACADAFANEGRLLAAVLASGVGNCSGLTTLYVAVGERAGIELRAVLVPYHTFPRLRLGTQEVDLEPTMGGIYQADGLDTLWFHSERARELDIYLRGLDRRTHLGVMMKAMVRPLIAAGRIERAVEIGEYATLLAPNFAHTWSGAGTALDAADRVGEARLALEHAIELDPTDPTSWSLLGESVLQRGEWGEAARCFEEVARLEAGVPTGLMRLAKSRQGQGDWEAAIECVHRARSLQWTQLHAVRRQVLEAEWQGHDGFEQSALKLLSELHLEASQGVPSDVDGTEGSRHEIVMRHLVKAGLATQLLRVMNGKPPQADGLEYLDLDARAGAAWTDTEMDRLRAELERRAAALRPKTPAVSGTPGTLQASRTSGDRTVETKLKD
ncbi:MAG: regulator of sirC expression with transglutaminase-like and TPR domain [Planctomycetota bacterium]|jgi:regulator of sirC expression with transglutaminase-like and TPR domain